MKCIATPDSLLFVPLFPCNSRKHCPAGALEGIVRAHYHEVGASTFSRIGFLQVRRYFLKNVRIHEYLQGWLSSVGDKLDHNFLAFQTGTGRVAIKGALCSDPVRGIIRLSAGIERAGIKVLALEFQISILVQPRTCVNTVGVNTIAVGKRVTDSARVSPHVGVLEASSAGVEAELATWGVYDRDCGCVCRWISVNGH